MLYLCCNEIYKINNLLFIFTTIYGSNNSCWYLDKVFKKKEKEIGTFNAGLYFNC